MLAGTGWLYAGDERFRVGPGDFFAKTEGPKLAHQFVNDGEADLRILSIGEHREDDAVEYPTPPWLPTAASRRGAISTDKRSSMDLGKLATRPEAGRRARRMDSLKEDAEELKDIATGDGSLVDKAKEAAEASRIPAHRQRDARQPRPQASASTASGMSKLK